MENMITSIDLLCLLSTLWKAGPNPLIPTHSHTHTHTHKHIQPSNLFLDMERGRFSREGLNEAM